MTIRIHFTPLEKEALRHRLDAGDCIAEAFADTDGMEHLAAGAEEAARQLSLRLAAAYPFDLEVDGSDELIREVLVEAIEGSTWNAVHQGDDVSPQRRSAASRSLQSAADKIAAAYGLDPLHVPQE